MPPSGSGGKKSKNAPDEMTEIRFYVPGTVNRDRGSDAGSQKSDDEEEVSAAQAFHDSIKEKAEIGQVAGDIILSFEEVLILTPRGRYDVDMFPEFLRLRGKTYDYKIMYTSIARLFLLPKDDQHVLFIVGLSRCISDQQLIVCLTSLVSAIRFAKARQGINTSSCSSPGKKRLPQSSI